MNSSNPRSVCLTIEQLGQIIQDDSVLDATSADHLDTCDDCKTRLSELTESEILRPYFEVASSTQFQSTYFGDGQPKGVTRPATSFGRYRIEREIGFGGMGIVYQAYDRELGRTVAIKVIKNIDSPSALTRFQREASSLSQLDHPNIVPVLTSGTTDDGKPFLVMPLIEGASLKHSLADEPLEPRDAARLMSQIARGLHAAHRAGLVHRDVKPANILLNTEKDNAKLLDFGLVRGDDFETLTHTEIFCGTPEYMSPEHANQLEKVDARSDTYSLGITLYECLTRSVPFRGRPLEVLAQHRDMEPISPCRMNNSVPRDLAVVCLKAIDKDPARRYATAELFADDLENFVAGRTISASPAGPIFRLWRWSRRNRALATAGSLLFLALLAGSITSTVLWLRSEASASLAEERNQSLLASQNVMRENQNALRRTLQGTFHDTLHKQDQFLQLPTSVRNTTLISLRQSSELMFETSRNDVKALRELVDDVCDVSEFAFSVQMEMRACELTHLNRQIVDHLSGLEKSGSLDDVLRVARVYNQHAEAQQALRERHDLNVSESDAAESFSNALRTSELASQTANQTARLDLVEQAELYSFRAKRGILTCVVDADKEKQIAQLKELFNAVDTIEKSEERLGQWLTLQARMLSDLAQRSSPEQSIDYRNQRAELLFELADWTNKHTGNSDTWILRNAAIALVLIGQDYANLGNVEAARKYYERGLGYLKSHTELYALNSYYRAGYFETLVLLAKLDWTTNSRETAMQRFESAVAQIELLVQMNPQDQNLGRRASQVLTEYGEKQLELEEHEEAATSFLKAAEHSKRVARNMFKMNPGNSAGDRATSIQLFEKAANAFRTAGYPEQASLAEKKLQDFDEN